MRTKVTWRRQPLRLALLLALLTMNVAAQPTGAAKVRGEPVRGIVLKDVPAKINVKVRYLFYLHGRIIEDEGVRPISPRYGVYEYEKILDAFKKNGFVVLSEDRPKGTEPRQYADKVIAQIQALLRAGVPEPHITVVGASKGAVITMLISARLKKRRVNFVTMGNCNDATLQQFGIELWGNVLSVYDASDDLGGSCQQFFDKATGLNQRQEIKLNTGLGHGFLYRPLKEWLVPTVEWAKSATRRVRAQQATQQPSAQKRGGGTFYERVAAKLVQDPALAQQLGKPPAELEEAQWLIGDWEVTARVFATKTSPERISHGEDVVRPALNHAKH
jgi:hypothetical protein